MSEYYSKFGLLAPIPPQGIASPGQHEFNGTMNWKSIGQTTLAGGAITGGALTAKAFLQAAAPALLKGRGVKGAVAAGARSVADQSKVIAGAALGGAALCGAAEATTQAEQKRIATRRREALREG